MSQPAEPTPLVTPAQGLPAWSPHAWDVLTETASTYGAVVTYGELAEAVQERSGVRTRSPQHRWVGDLLRTVLDRCTAEGRPQLSALVVHKADGEVGEGYDEVLRATGTEPFVQPMQREEHAAGERLACYRAWGADVPEDARPQLSPRLRQRVDARPAAEPRRGAPCPSCFLEMPVSGVCASCG